MKDLDYFFKPESVAIIGASRFPRKFGYVILENFLSSDFHGKVYPVNPKADAILMQKCYPSVNDIPDKIDMAVITLPAKYVVDAVKDCVKKKVKACVIITGGFGEVGNKKAEEKILEIAKGKMRIIGPNVIGIYDAYSHVDTVFSARYRQERPERGSVGFISQSGAFGAAIMDWAATEGMGISKFVSIGNRIDVDEVDLLEYLGEDKETKAIALYLEGSKRGRELFEMLKKVSKKKPVVVLKAGTTSEGKQAIASHTGSMAGSSAVFSGMLKQAGAIEAKTADDLFGFAKAFAYQPLPKNNRVQIVTNGGGFGVIATDAVIEQGLRLAKPTKKTLNSIKKQMPEYVVLGNPIDLIGDSDSARYRVALEAVLKDKNVDGVVVIILLQISALESDIVNVLISLNRKYKKPMVVCSTGGEFTKMHNKMLEKEGIPTYSSPKKAVSAMRVLCEYAKSKHRLFS